MRLILMFLALLALSACNLGRDDGNNGDDGDQQPIITSTPAGAPTVNIISPQDGDEVVVNDPVLISVNATDSVGVTRVQLFADGQIVRTLSSESPSGDRNMNVLLDHTPRSQGEVTYRVVAFRGAISSEPDEIMVNVRRSQTQVTATAQISTDVPVIDPNDPTCRALINTALNFRTGPSVNFERIAVLSPGEVIPIVGRLGDNSWWQLLRNGVFGWVSAGFVTPYGNCSGVPVLPFPATATPIVLTSTLIPTNTPLPTNTPVPALPNLTVSNVSGDEVVVIPVGETSVTISYGMNVTNNGASVDAQFTSGVRILPGGDEFESGVAGNLGAGQTIALSVDVTFDMPGAYLLQFTADVNDEIEESNEGDNSYTYDVTVENE